jgi:hypothetical protein
LNLTLAVAFLAMSGAQRERGASTFDLSTYLQELHRVRSSIATAATTEEARAFAADLADRWWVTVEADVIVVDTRWIDDEVAASVSQQRRWPAVRESIEQRLATMHASASNPAAVRAHAPRQILESVLARPEFKRSASSTWLEDLRNRFGDWVLRMLNRLTGSGAGGRTVATALAWILSIATLMALAFWLVTMIMRRSAAAVVALGATSRRRTPAREWAIRALGHARAGDIRDAVRCGYRAALCRLDEQGVWTVDESRTPREYLSLLGLDDPRLPALTDLTRQFEQIWYGHRAATADDARMLSTRLERLGCVSGSERAI